MTWLSLFPPSSFEALVSAAREDLGDAVADNLHVASEKYGNYMSTSGVPTLKLASVQMIDARIAAGMASEDLVAAKKPLLV